MSDSRVLVAMKQSSTIGRSMPYVSGWDGTAGKEQVRLIAWGENQETTSLCPVFF